MANPGKRAPSAHDSPNFCHTDQRERKGQPLVDLKQCHVITSTVVHIKEELRPLASRRLGTALYAVDEASEGAIL
jgi:hypothetical protein